MRRGWARLERALVGAGMTVVAFVLERRVLKGIKDRGEVPPTGASSPFSDAEVTHSTGEDERPGGRA